MNEHDDNDDAVDDMDEVNQISEYGKLMLANGTADTTLQPEDVLILEVMNRGIDLAGWQIDDLCMQAVKMFGSAAKAVAAIRAGEIDLARSN
jgi:hypothetical protein